MTRPTGISVLAVLHFIVGGMTVAGLFLVMLPVAMRPSDAVLGLPALVALFVGALGALSLMTGVGLSNLKPYGRTMQIAWAVVGLLAIPFGTIISIVILLYMFRPEIKVTFSGRSGDQLTPQETATLQMAAAARSSTATVVAVGLVVTIAAIGLVGTVAAMTVAGLDRVRTWENEAALKGGVDLVLRVETDDALRLVTDTEMDRLRDALQSTNITFTDITMVSSTRWRVEGVPPDMDANFRRTADGVRGIFDYSDGTKGTYVFTMRPVAQASLRDQAVVQTREAIARRLNDVASWARATREDGSSDNIRVRLPGGIDIEHAKSIMAAAGDFELKIVQQGPASSKDSLLVNGKVPPGMQIVPDGSTSGETSYYLVRKVAALTARDVRNARPSLDENNQPAVSFTLNNEGARKFGDLTGRSIGRQLAIILDGTVQSAPRIDSRVTTDGRITGSFTTEEVQNLSLILRSGALPARVIFIKEAKAGE